MNSENKQLQNLLSQQKKQQYEFTPLKDNLNMT